MFQSKKDVAKTILYVLLKMSLEFFGCEIVFENNNMMS